ncbi:unnamed protein product [Nezara viridula]|uniref:Uncharacterized protein n=1 Tax=Nezara viridula TaxID=85310 RepID=A0A9P0HVI7_NEZVI|nr:unnamed protein product [Nezara viridula]CAH1408408.1 unnamed protein product [Nezara viridula]
MCRSRGSHAEPEDAADRAGERGPAADALGPGQVRQLLPGVAPQEDRRLQQVAAQNLLFYYDSESCARPSGVVMLEGCYCERLISPPSKNKDAPEKQNPTFKIFYLSHLLEVVIEGRFAEVKFLCKFSNSFFSQSQQNIVIKRGSPSKTSFIFKTEVLRTFLIHGWTVSSLMPFLPQR